MKIGHIPGHFNTRSGRIWLTNYMSALQAWPNKENVHLRILILKTFSQRFLLNILRDFQKMSNYENWPYSGPFYYQIW
jgi:hypothetical protein